MNTTYQFDLVDVERLRMLAQLTPGGRIRLMLSAPFLDVSSSAVRRLLAEKSHCPALDEAVLAHIHRHGLYTGAVDARPDNEDS